MKKHLKKGKSKKKINKTNKIKRTNTMKLTTLKQENSKLKYLEKKRKCVKFFK